MKFSTSIRSIPFKDPVNLEDQIRKIILIQLKAGKEIFYGECSPYPFPEQEKKRMIYQIEAGMDILLRHWNKKNISFKELLFLLSEEAKINFWDLSSLFAIETIATQLFYSRDEKISEFSFAEINKITLNALVNNELPDQIENEVLCLMKQGYSCFKMKIDSNNEENFLRVKRLRDSMGDKYSIRLDFNRKLRLKEAVEFAQKIKEFNIEYIEEPVSNPDDIETFFAETKIYYALDESLMEVLSSIREKAHFWILKPMRSGLLNSLLLKEEASQKEIKVIFTSNFETEIGMGAILPFITDQKTPMGFDTLKYFPGLLLTNSLKIENAHLRFSFPKYLNELNTLNIF